MEELHEIRREIARLRATHTKLLEGLLTCEPFIQGSVVRRFSVCGKPGCRCTRGEKHGPFWYLSRTVGGRTQTRYLRKELAEATIVSVQAYQRWWRLRQRLRKVEGEVASQLDRLGALLSAAGEGGARSWRAFCGDQIRIKPGMPS